MDFTVDVGAFPVVVAAFVVDLLDVVVTPIVESVVLREVVVVVTATQLLFVSSF